MLKTLTKVFCVLLVLLTILSAVPRQAVSADTAELPKETISPTEVVTEPVEETQSETVAETVPAVLTETTPETMPVTIPEEVSEETEEAIPEETEEMVPEEDQDTETQFTEVPLYFQTDYPDKLFGSGTIANNGCSVTCLAMVATYLTEHEYLPDELARYFGGLAENNIERLEKGATAMQLPWKRMANFHKAMEALREGQIVIALMGWDSIFTDSQHFIVLTGFNEDGLITVHDPNEANYTKWDLERAFQEGFTEGDICCGFSGAWAFDKSAMPEEPFLYYEEALGDQSRYQDLKLTREEIQLLARVIWVEARGESEEGQQAVAEVILNRMASDQFPDTLEDIIYADGQFRSAGYLDDAEAHQVQFEAIDRAIYGPYILPEDVVHFATYATNKNVWGQIGAHIFCYEY